MCWGGSTEVTSIINIDAVLPYFTRMPLSSLGLGRCCHWWRWSARSCVLCYCLLGRFVRSFVVFLHLLCFSSVCSYRRRTPTRSIHKMTRGSGKPKHHPSVLRDDMTAGWRWWWWRSFVIASVAASTHVWLQCFSFFTLYEIRVVVFFFLWYFVFLWLFRQILLHHSWLFVVDVQIVVSIYRRICLLSIRSSVWLRISPQLCKVCIFFSLKTTQFIHTHTHTLSWIGFVGEKLLLELHFSLTLFVFMKWMNVCLSVHPSASPSVSLFSFSFWNNTFIAIQSFCFLHFLLYCLPLRKL